MTDAPSTTPSARATDWLTPGRFGALLALFIFAAYPEVVLGQQTFFFRDFGFFGYPLAFHHKESLLRGEIPLWNPLSNCGLPFLAQWNSLVLYPGSLIYLLLPLSWSLAIFCLFHQWLGGLGMFWLLRRWTGSNFGAAIAGVSYAFGGLLLNSLMWPNNVAAFALLPWVIGWTERGWREGGKALLAATALGAVQMLSGAPEVILFTWLVIGVFWALALVNERFERGARAGRLALNVLWVAGLCAAQLLPFLDLLLHSQRDTNFAHGTWSMPPLGWANLLVPLFHCFAANQGVFFQYEQWWTSSYYIPVGAVLLAALAVWRVRERRVWIFAVLLLFSLLMALGNNGFLYPALKGVLPFLGFLRYPIKFVILALFCLPALAAYGLTAIERRLAAGEGFDRRPVAILWLAATGLTGFILWAAARYPEPLDDWAATWQNGLARAGFLAVGTALLFAIFHGPSPRLRALWQLVLLSVLWLDAATHAPRQNPVAPRGVFEPGLVKLQPQPRHGESRVMISRDADMYFRVTSTTRGMNQYIGNRLGEFSNCNLLDDIPKVNGFYSLFLREQEEIRALLYNPEATNLDFNPVLNFMGVSHITSATNAFEWSRRARWFPFVSAGQAPQFVPDDKTLAALFLRGFDPRRVVILPASAKGRITASGEGQAEVSEVKVRPQAVQLEVAATGPALVVVAQANYHAWRARVDGQSAEILRANHAFQAVQVPAGHHRVELVYQDDAFRLGVLVSAATLAAVLFLWRVEARSAKLPDLETAAHTAPTP